MAGSHLEEEVSAVQRDPLVEEGVGGELQLMLVRGWSTPALIVV